jgi:hypothetical protein
MDRVLGLEPRLTTSEAALLPLEDSRLLDGTPGFEPGLNDSKSPLLPLEDTPLWYPTEVTLPVRSVCNTDALLLS